MPDDGGTPQNMPALLANESLSAQVELPLRWTARSDASWDYARQSGAVGGVVCDSEGVVLACFSEDARLPDGASPARASHYLEMEALAHALELVRAMGLKAKAGALYTDSATTLHWLARQDLNASEEAFANLTRRAQRALREVPLAQVRWSSRKGNRMADWLSKRPLGSASDLNEPGTLSAIDWLWASTVGLEDNAKMQEVGRIRMPKGQGAESVGREEKRAKMERFLELATLQAAKADQGVKVLLNQYDSSFSGTRRQFELCGPGDFSLAALTVATRQLGRGPGLWPKEAAQGGMARIAVLSWRQREGAFGPRRKGAYGLCVSRAEKTAPGVGASEDWIGPQDHEQSGERCRFGAWQEAPRGRSMQFNAAKRAIGWASRSGAERARIVFLQNQALSEKETDQLRALAIKFKIAIEFEFLPDAPPHEGEGLARAWRTLLRAPALALAAQRKKAAADEAPQKAAQAKKERLARP